MRKLYIKGLVKNADMLPADDDVGPLWALTPDFATDGH